MTEKIPQHTVKQYDAELSELNDMARDMANRVKVLVDDAIAAFDQFDMALAQSVIGRNAAIGDLEQRIDREVIRLLARRAPVASDLRQVMTVSKCAGDLEKIGDEAVKIGHTVIQQFGTGCRSLSGPMRQSARAMMAMAKSAICNVCDLFATPDPERAAALTELQTRVAEEFQAQLRLILTHAMEDVRTLGPAMSLLLVLRSLERIADYAENLSEHWVHGIDADPKPMA